jgi:dihydrofolate reductase
MRKISYGGANSLDTYLSGPRGETDWLMWSPEPEAARLMADSWKNVDAVLCGRKTFEAAVRMGAADKTIPGVTGYVFSRTLPDGATGPNMLVREDAAAFVRRLKSQPGKDIILMGGGELARSLFEADLIDEVGMNIHPLLLGDGAPMFQPLSRRINLELAESRTFKNGCVYLRYRVKHAA